MGLFPFVLSLTSLVCPAAADEKANAPADPELKAARAIDKALGVEFAVLESKVRRSIISTRTPYGFKISKVEKDSPAARAGWKKGDILLKWNGRPIKTLAGLSEAIKKIKPKEAATFRLARYKKNVSLLSRQPWEYIEGKVTPK